MTPNERTGLHLHLEDTFTNTIAYAHKMEVKRFQFFLVPQKGKRYKELSDDDKQGFLALRDQFAELYIHTSYWVNLASGDDRIAGIAKELMVRELELAKQLEVNYLVLHPGSAKRFIHPRSMAGKKKKGIQRLLKNLDEVLNQDAANPVGILIENNPHGGATLGGDFADLTLMREAVESSPRLGYCLDYAHAYAYGYSLDDPDTFIQKVDESMGLENIKLIHLNDSMKKRGSKIDAHAPPGQGLIGTPVLKQLHNHAALNDKPVILELPGSHMDQAEKVLTEVWHW